MDEKIAAGMFKALSDQTRIQMVRYLVSCGKEGAAAGDISEHVGAASSRASFHLAALEKAGMVSVERQSRKMIYRANLNDLGGLISFLLDDCCGRNPDILSCCSISGTCD